MEVADQAEQLREYVRGSKRQARVLAVTSGKGGVGKTGTSVNLSIALAMRGKDVVLLDADLGLANVEVIQARMESYRPGEKFATIITRAVADRAMSACVNTASETSR